MTPIAKIIRRRKKHFRKTPPRPIVSKRPWAGFMALDSPRPKPLARCPSPRCRRAKCCIAAVANLYCLRTHHSRDEQANIRRASTLQRDLDDVLPVADPTDLKERMERIAALAEVRAAHERAMKEKWKSGALDHLYGPYRSFGVVLAPPAKSYEEP